MPFANNNGVKIHYEVEGQGPPLILQHGLTYNVDCWYDTGFVEKLGKDYRLIMVDARGHGISDKPHDLKNYNPEIIAQDYVSVLDKLGIEKSSYYGYSLGGSIAFMCLARHVLPRFFSLIIGGMRGYSSSPEAESKSRRQVAAQMEADMSKGMEGYLVNMERSIGPLPFHEKLLKNDVQALVTFRKAAAEWPYINDILPMINIPCLLICGDADPYFNGAKETASHLPNAKFVSLNGLTHSDCISRGDLVIPIIKKFLDEVNKA